CFLGQVFGFDGVAVIRPGAAGTVAGQIPGENTKAAEQFGEHVVPDALGHAQRMGQDQQRALGLAEQAVADGAALVSAECHGEYPVWLMDMMFALRTKVFNANILRSDDLLRQVPPTIVRRKSNSR